MIAGFRDTGSVIYEHGIDAYWLEDQIDFARSFDAVSNWTGENPANETVSQGDHLDFQTKNFTGFQQLAEDLDVDYIPVVQPGFDDRENEC